MEKYDGDVDGYPLNLRGMAHPRFSIAPELVPQSAPIDGSIAPDESSPSGYSIYKLGQWIPLAYATKNKKKKPKTSKEAEAEALQQQREQQEKEAKEYAAKLDAQMQQAIFANPAICVLETAPGYAIVATNRKYNIQKNVEKGAGFQPYESVKEQELTVITMLIWATPERWCKLAEQMQALNIMARSEHVMDMHDLNVFMMGAQ